MALSETEKRKNFLKKHGLKRFNSAIRTTEGGKKGKIGIVIVAVAAIYWIVT